MITNYNIPPPPIKDDANDFVWHEWHRQMRELLTKDNIMNKMSWNSTDKTLEIAMGLDGVTLQVGMEEYYPPVLNNTSSTITEGTLIGFTGVSGSVPTVAPYIADGTIPYHNVMGIATMDIPTGEQGIVTKFGYIHNVNTTGTPVGETWAVGDILYASPTVAGKLTKVKPTAPDEVIVVAAVVTVNASTGLLLVRVTPQPTYKYGVFSDSTTQSIAVANTPQALVFDTTNFSNGVTRGTPTSRIITAVSGLYQFQLSLQLTSTSASTKTIYLWQRKNGVDIPNTTRAITVSGNSTTVVPAWDYVVSHAANDYFEIIAACSDTTVSFSAQAAQTVPYARPSTPSCLLTVTQVSL